jgi:hypothetical protein
MSLRRAWSLVVVSVGMALVCFRQASAAAEVPEVPMRRVCMAGVRVELSNEAPGQGATSREERRPSEIGEPCALPWDQRPFPRLARFP